MHRLLRLCAGIDNGGRARSGDDHIADHRLDAFIDWSVDAFLDCLPAGAHLGALPSTSRQRAAMSSGFLAILAIKHDTAWFTTDIRDAPHQLGFGRYVDAGFRVAVIMP